MGTVSAQRPGWGGYSQLRRPVRPPAGATQEQLESLYPDLVVMLAQRTSLWGDGVDHRAYAWEEDCLDQGPLISEPEAREFIGQLWERYAHRHEPAFTAPPALLVVPHNELSGALMNTLAHRIVISECCLRRAWLAHEIGHALNPRTQHCARWEATMVTIWRDEFGVPIERSRQLGSKYGPLEWE
jgi:hypothetical protein